MSSYQWGSRLWVTWGPRTKKRTLMLVSITTQSLVLTSWAPMLHSRSLLSQSFASKPLDLLSLNLGFCVLLFFFPFSQALWSVVGWFHVLADLARLDTPSLWFPSNLPCLAPVSETGPSDPWYLLAITMCVLWMTAHLGPREESLLNMSSALKSFLWVLVMDWNSIFRDN